MKEFVKCIDASINSSTTFAYPLILGKRYILVKKTDSGIWIYYNDEHQSVGYSKKRFTEDKLVINNDINIL